VPFDNFSRSDVLALLQATETAVAAAKAASAAAAAAARGASTRETTKAAAALTSLELRLAFLRGELGVLTDLRADFTQDEGAYSSYLDKDEWYERDRRRALGIGKRPKKLP
jgi:hypothetical protein